MEQLHSRKKHRRFTDLDDPRLPTKKTRIQQDIGIFFDSLDYRTYMEILKHHTSFANRVHKQLYEQECRFGSEIVLPCGTRGALEVKRKSSPPLSCVHKGEWPDAMKLWKEGGTWSDVRRHYLAKELFGRLQEENGGVCLYLATTEYDLRNAPPIRTRYQYTGNDTLLVGVEERWSPNVCWLELLLHIDEDAKSLAKFRIEMPPPAVTEEREVVFDVANAVGTVKFRQKSLVYGSGGMCVSTLEVRLPCDLVHWLSEVAAISQKETPLPDPRGLLFEHEGLLVLELFCGTGSFSEVAKRYGFRTITLDMDPKSNPDILTDIMQWDYRSFAESPFLIWASPPCTEWSLAKTTAPRDLETARNVIGVLLEIVRHFGCYYILENPVGLLRKEKNMTRIPRYTASYCRYQYEYRKNTDFWSNALDHFKPLYCKKGECRHGFVNEVTGKFVHNSAMCRKQHVDQRVQARGKTVYPIPPLLCLSMLVAVLKKFSQEHDRVILC